MTFRRCILLLPLLLLACDHATEPEFSLALPAIDVPWTADQPIVCFGTSLTYGYIGWEEPIGRPLSVKPEIPEYPSETPDVRDVDTISYPYHLGLKLRIPVRNAGIVGATTQNALNVVGDSVFAKHPALVLLEFGANDFLRLQPVSEAESRLRRLVDTLLLSGTKVVLVSFMNEEMMTSLPADHYMAPLRPIAEAYLAMLRRVAADRGLLFVEWAMKGIYWNESLLSDAVHPNGVGYRIMAENIYASLAATFERNGMKK